MATTTPNFGWPVPTSTDLVKDGAVAIEGLGDAIDASMLDFKGGTTGQVLAKATNTDMDFSWVTTDDTNAIQNAIVDAKGDLISATANDTPARLAVGANNTVLTADSTTATGLKWAAAGGGGGSGLTLIKRQAFTAVSGTGTTFDSMFNSTYPSYMIVIENLFGSVDNTQAKLNWRVSAATQSAASYNYYNNVFTGGAVSGATNATTDTGYKLFTLDTEVVYGGTAVITTSTVGGISQRVTHNSTLISKREDTYGIGGGQYKIPIIADGFILLSASGTITGTVSVYGLAK